MGQKTNPIIFRIKNIKNRECCSFENKKTEKLYMDLSTYFIEKFMFRIFKSQGLSIANIYIKYNNKGSLHIFINYCVLPNKTNKGLNNTLQYNTSASKNKSFLEFNSVNKKNISNKKRYKNILLQKIIAILRLVVGVHTNIYITLYPLSNFRKQLTKKSKSKETKLVSKLRRLEKNEFLRPSFDIIKALYQSEKPAKILGFILAQQIKKARKKHRFLLNIIKSLLGTTISNKQCNINGIKIKIKGRVDGSRRSKQRVIALGKDIATSTLSLKKIDYATYTAYTVNGTIGIKIWIV